MYLCLSIMNESDERIHRVELFIPLVKKNLSELPAFKEYIL